MKKSQLWDKFVARTGRKTIASVLALSMILSGTAYAMTGTKAEDTSKEEEKVTFMSGDVNLDGRVDLVDAQQTLKASLKLMKLEGVGAYAADVNGDDQITLKDAQLILKHALKLQTLPSKEPPVTSEEPEASGAPGASAAPASAAPASEAPASKAPIIIPTIPPVIVKTEKPKPSLNPVAADPANVVTSQALEVKKLNGAQKSDDGNTIVLGDISTAAGAAVRGVELVNPFAGRNDLRQTPQEATRLSSSAVDPSYTKPTVWELTGGSILAQDDYDFHAADPRVYVGADDKTGAATNYKPDEVDYTIPKWTNGVTLSFWLKANTETEADNTIVFENQDFILNIRMNGTVNFDEKISSENKLQMTSSRSQGKNGEWAYYTVTIANDWIEVYVNGQKNLYNTVTMSRKGISQFNDGFLTRYNPVGDIFDEDMAQDENGNWYTTKDHDYVRGYYYTTLGITNQCAWYFNEEKGKYMFHDNFSTFGNCRFRGASTGAPLIMDLLTDKSTKMYIAGSDSETTSDTESLRTLLKDTNISDLKVYERELTDEQVAACYAYDTVTPDAITWDPNKASGDEDASQVATGEGINIAEDGLSAWADYDADKDIITFKDATAMEGEVPVGVQVVNPFVKKTELVESLESALSGQAIFPYINEDGTVPAGSTNVGCQVARGNFYDVYYGDINKMGNEMNPQTGNNLDQIMTEEQVKATYGSQVTTYQRPEWNTGATISFWAKPTKVDDSPLLTFYSASKANGMMMVMSVRGDICYYSLRTNKATDGSVAKDWTKEAVLPNGEPKNTFAALGDGSYVNANEWNYYTLTIANDWIQVYVNGKELVYQEVNLRRNDIKYFNKGYMTRYSPVGIWTNETIEKNMTAFGHDGTGKTLEETPRNYVLKSGQYYDFTLGTDENGNSVYYDKGRNNSRDEASIRMNGVYENPYKHSGQCPLLMENFTAGGIKMYFGGVKTKFTLDQKYNFNNLKVGDVNEPAPATGEAATVQYVEDHWVADETAPDGKRIHPNYLAKIFYADHTISAGTQVHGMKTHYNELTAEEVKAEYEAAARPE